MVVRQEFRKKFLPKCVRWHALFLLYRKVLKKSDMMYNNQEIKNDMTKERRCDFAMTLIMKFFVLLVELHYLTIEKELL